MQNYITQFPEITILIINLTFILVSYLLIYPEWAKDDINKIMKLDIFFSLLSMIVVGLIFWNSNNSFNIFITTVNWFWFYLITYFIIESWFFAWYKKKYNVNMNPENNLKK